MKGESRRLISEGSNASIQRSFSKTPTSAPAHAACSEQQIAMQQDTEKKKIGNKRQGFAYFSSSTQLSPEDQLIH